MTAKTVRKIKLSILIILKLNWIEIVILKLNRIKIILRLNLDRDHHC